LGEIADALRRARESQFDEGRREPRAASPHAPSPLAPLVGALEPAPTTAPPRAAVAPHATARQIESLDAADPILVTDDVALDACRRVALRIRNAMSRASLRSLAVASAVRGEGKTTVTCDLAIAMASLSKEGEVALVDLDLRNPSIARRLGVEVDVGVEQYLSGDAALDELRVRIQKPGFELYPVGAPVREAHELLVSPRFAQMIRELEARHPLVLIDTPACLVASDTAIILEKVASVALLARFGVTRMRNFRQLISSIPRAKILGQVMNGVRVPRHRYYDYYGPESMGDDLAESGEREVS
jgi:Mrp family chromosome partitioning ATPase